MVVTDSVLVSVVRQVTFILLVVLAIATLWILIIRHWMFVGIDQPPSDFGTGGMFDVIASRYDMVNRVLAMGMDIGWRRQMVQAIAASAVVTNNNSDKIRILDIATGTADVAILLAQQIPHATILGIDPSINMLDHGRIKISSQQELDGRIDLQVFDARHLLPKLEPSSFDAATAAFGIRNVVPHRDQALCQIRTVLKDTACFAILEFSEPDPTRETTWHAAIMAALTRLFILYVVPVIGAMLSGAPREYWHLQNSIREFPNPAIFARSLEELSCPLPPLEDGTASDIGSFRVDDVIHMTFGSVQLYLTTAIRKDGSHPSREVGSSVDPITLQGSSSIAPETMDRIDNHTPESNDFSDPEQVEHVAADGDPLGAQHADGTVTISYITSDPALTDQDEQSATEDHIPRNTRHVTDRSEPNHHNDHETNKSLDSDDSHSEL